MPIEPPSSPWAMPNPLGASAEGLAGIGADLEPGTLLAAYRSGLFPMPVTPEGPMGWWSPDPRGVLPVGALRVSRSLRRACAHYEVRFDTAFAEVVAACADPARPHGWINDEIQQAYCELHAQGWAHSVEAWSVDDGMLVGGLYGVAIGGLFAGESMFHRRADASKVALVALVALLSEDGDAGRLVDVQWLTPHLASLGAVEMPAVAYLACLERALACPLPRALAR
ncbi:MAG: leucyl/phenylalanyl-tRNA--protein transferase [Acidimicrobiales bacterium]